MKKFRNSLLSSSLVAALMFTSFSAGTAEAARSGYDKNKVGGKVILTSFADAVKLTPLIVSDSASIDIIGMLYDSLVKLDIKGNAVPALATSWKYDKSKLTYTFELRKGVKWHDGKPFTAKDVKFAYDVYMDAKSFNSYKSLFDAVKSTQAVGDYQFKIVLKEKDVLFLENTVAAAPIIAKHKFPKGVEDYNNNNAIHRKPVGTGPFKFKDWKSDERISVVANTGYWNGRPYMDEVVTRILPDANVEAINLLKGDVDFVEALDAKTLPQVAKNKSLKTLKYDYGRFDFVGFNSAVAPFNDERFRKALAYGLDRQSIVSKIQLGRAYLGSGPMHPAIPQNNPSVKALPFDLAKAAKLLDEAGWKLDDGVRKKNGKKLEIEFAYNNGNKVRERIALLAQQNWGKLGIKVTPRSYEWSIFLDKYQKGELDAFALGWGGYDANVDHYAFFHSSGIPSDKNANGVNRNRVNDPAVDKLLEQYKQEENRAKRIQIYQQLHKYMADNEVLIWTYHPKLTAGMDKDLAGVKMSIANVFFSIEDWHWSVASKRK